MLKGGRPTIPARAAYVMIVLAFVMLVFSGGAKSSEKQSGAAIEKISFRNIPGITRDEINAIETLQKKYNSLVYGMSPSTEAFIGKDGGIHGYAPLFCEWLTEMFEIPFKIVFYEWGDLMKGLESGEIDFTGELMISPERRKTYYMTSPIVDRSLKVYRIRGGETLNAIIKSRPPRYAFLKGSVLQADVTEDAGYVFETVFVDDYNTAYRMLKNGEADAYFGLDTTDAAFRAFSDVVVEDFYPVIFKSACLSTQKAELAPVINAVEKLLNEKTLGYLSGLYKQGHQQYQEDKLYNQLTEEERAYIQNNPVIPVAAEFNNYPLSFFDNNTNQWHGIYFDTLDEITRLTGLEFRRANDQNTQNNDLIDMLEKGEVLIMPELFQIKEYKGRFLWSKIPILQDTYAFLSKSDYQNVEISQIPYVTVGIRRDSVYLEFFKKMFPNHRHLFEYDTQEEVWSALKRDEVEVIFACNRRLTTYTNFYEEAGYKLNLIINQSFDSSFGYNKDASVLKSIVDKALIIININNIANQWMYKAYDYRYKLVEAQRPWLIGAAVLSFFVLLLVLILLIRSRSAGRQLETVVKKRTSELSFKSSQLQMMVDSIPDLMFCKDVDLKYTQCNRQFEDFVGVRETDIIGKTDMDGKWLTGESVENIFNIEKSVLSEKQPVRLEEYVSSVATGNKGYFETVKAPIKQDGDIVGIIAIIRDVTRRKEMEEEVKAASRAKSSFLANMSHELRTPLNVVIGLTDLILEDEMTDHVRQNLVKISNAGNTLLSIVNDILDFSKIESGKLSLSPVEYYTSSILNDIITLTITRLEEKPVAFYLDIEDDLPNKLYGDDLRVKQILTNLLTNAVKYTNEGSVGLIVRCTREGGTVWMDVTVKDTGMGIPKDDIKNLFLDYYQVAAKSNRNIEGTGLGLPITKRLVEMMDGGIDVESECGKGSAFHFRIRQGYVDDAVLGADVSEKLRNFCYSDDKRTVTRKLVRVNLSYARVLVIDDMQTNLDVAAGILRKYQMQVDCINNGPAAIDRIREGKPVYNAIFMDHMMPGMDGIETADRIRGLGTDYAKKIPIIALTANAIQGTDKMFYEHDFQAFITKPIDVMEMDSVLRKWVYDNKREQASVSDAPVSGESGFTGDETEEIKIKIPGVDTKKGLSLYAGEMDIYLPLLRSYIANTPGTLEKLRAVSADTLSDYVINVHGLKGTNAGIGAEAIREAALDLENKSRAGDLQGVLAGNGKLIADTEIIVENIKAWLRQYDAENAKPRQKAPDRGLLARIRQSCENYDMIGVDKAMSELDKYDYEEDAELVAWLKEKINVSEFAETAERLAKY